MGQRVKRSMLEDRTMPVRSGRLEAELNEIEQADASRWSSDLR